MQVRDGSGSFLAGHGRGGSLEEFVISSVLFWGGRTSSHLISSVASFKEGGLLLLLAPCLLRMLTPVLHALGLIRTGRLGFYASIMVVIGGPLRK